MGARGFYTSLDRIEIGICYACGAWSGRWCGWWRRRGRLGEGGEGGVVSRPSKLLSQVEVLKHSSVGSAVAFLGHITLFQGRHPSKKRENVCILSLLSS